MKQINIYTLKFYLRKYSVFFCYSFAVSRILDSVLSSRTSNAIFLQSRWSLLLRQLCSPLIGKNQMFRKLKHSTSKSYEKLANPLSW